MYSFSVGYFWLVFVFFLFPFLSSFVSLPHCHCPSYSCQIGASWWSDLAALFPHQMVTFNLAASSGCSGVSQEDQSDSGESRKPNCLLGGKNVRVEQVLLQSQSSSRCISLFKLCQEYTASSDGFVAFCVHPLLVLCRHLHNWAPYHCCWFKSQVEPYCSSEVSGS